MQADMPLNPQPIHSLMQKVIENHIMPYPITLLRIRFMADKRPL